MRRAGTTSGSGHQGSGDAAGSKSAKHEQKPQKSGPWAAELQWTKQRVNVLDPDESFSRRRVSQFSMGMYSCAFDSEAFPECLHFFTNSMSNARTVSNGQIQSQNKEGWVGR